MNYEGGRMKIGYFIPHPSSLILSRGGSQRGFEALNFITPLIFNVHH
jgi:hypothetical protein